MNLQNAIDWIGIVGKFMLPWSELFSVLFFATYGKTGEHA
jgi:hypothetical protein